MPILLCEGTDGGGGRTGRERFREQLHALFRESARYAVSGVLPKLFGDRIRVRGKEDDMDLQRRREIELDDPGTWA